MIKLKSQSWNPTKSQATVFLFLLLSHRVSHDCCQLPKMFPFHMPTLTKLCVRVLKSVSSSLDDNTDQGASEIGLLTESSTATAQSAQCKVPVAASSSIGKRPRSKTLKAVPKKSLGRGHSPLPRPYPRWGGDTNSPYPPPSLCSPLGDSNLAPTVVLKSRRLCT